MLRNILVPLDGSDFGEHALPMALRVARRTNGTVRLLHVLQPFVTVVPELSAYQGPLEAEYREGRQKYLDALAARIKEVSTVPVSTELVEGDIAPTIKKAVEAGKPDLVVMTTHGRGPLGRFWLGSVADRMVRELTVPLLLVHPGKEPLNLKAEPPVKDVLLPLDGSPLAEQIIPPAAELARAMGAGCTLLRVVRSDIPDVTGAGGQGAMVTQRIRLMVEELETLQQQLREEAGRYLEAVAGRVRALGVRVETKVVLDEKPATGILRQAEAGTDLIALQTHGRGGLQRLWLGSVADKVIRGASVPVLVQRPRQ